MIKSGVLLFNSSDFTKITHSKILNLRNKNAVIRLKLHSLLKLPEPPKKLLQKSFITYPLLTSYLKPGDIINVNDLKKINSPIIIDNILVDIHDETTEPFMAFNFTDCNEYNENDEINLEFVTYKSYSRHPNESYWKFNVFDEIIKRKFYGVDRRYLNKNYKCMKITICSEFKRQKLIIPSVHVINLVKQTVNKSNTFDNENIVLRYKVANETHYVARTERGHCLFQVIIYYSRRENFGNRS